MKKRYIYNGSVMRFGKEIASNYKAETFAVSPVQAKNNIAFRIKNDMGLIQATNIELPGRIEESRY